MRFGLDADDNTNTTRRLLFLLESVPLLGERAHREAAARDPRRLPRGRAPRPPAAAVPAQRRRALLADDLRRLRGQGAAGVAQVGAAPREAADVAHDALRRRACCPSWPATTSSPTRSSRSSCRPWPSRRPTGVARAFLEHDAADAGGAHARRLRPLPGAHRRPRAARRASRRSTATPRRPTRSSRRRAGSAARSSRGCWRCSSSASRCGASCASTSSCRPGPSGARRPGNDDGRPRGAPVARHAAHPPVRAGGWAGERLLLELDEPPASSSSVLSFSPSSRSTPSRIALGASSTSALASLRPRPVAARTTLMTWIFLSPARGQDDVDRGPPPPPRRRRRRRRRRPARPRRRPSPRRRRSPRAP